MMAGTDFNRFDGLGDRNNFLDCLRAIAAFLVLACHSGLLLGGGIGVSIFFCLSGFLIASILLQREPTRENVGRFVLRRFMRIWPMMVVQIGATAALLYIEAPENFADYITSMLGLLTFTSPVNLPYMLSRSVLWTLQAEFWFYVMAAAIVLIFGRRGLFVAALLGIAVAWPAKMGWLELSVSLPPRQGILYADQLMAGVLCAFGVRYMTGIAKTVLASRAFLWLPLAAIMVISTLKFRGYDHPWFYASSATAYLTAIVILHQWARPFTGDYEPIATLGRISYSIYLLHAVVFDFVGWHIFPPALQLLFNVGLTVLLSMITYRWVELPFIAWSKRSPLQHTDDVITNDSRLNVRDRRARATLRIAGK